MTHYLTPDSKDAFLDFPLKEPSGPFTKMCPICKGHGGWNLKLNQYPIPKHLPNTPENRHRYLHFKQHCVQCSGYGYVTESDNCPGHLWEHVRHISRCYDEYVCTICNKTHFVDSTD